MAFSPLSRSLPPLFLILPFFFWGTAMVAMKGTLAHTTPFFLATTRLLPAGILVLLAASVMKRSQPTSWQGWLWIIGFAGVDGTLFQGFLAQGLTQTSAGLGSVMIDSQPLAVAILAAWFFGESLGLWGWLGLGGGLVGISFLGVPQHWFSEGISLSTFLEGQTIGQLWMLAAALAMAVGTVMSRWVSEWVDPIVATGWHMILGAIPLAIGALWEGRNAWQFLTLGDYAALGYSTVLGSAVAYALFFYFAAQGNLTSLSSLTFLTPVFALTFGVTFLGETLSPWQFLGVFLTLISVYIVNQREQISRLWGSEAESLSAPDLEEP